MYGVTQATFDKYKRVQGADTYPVGRITKFEAREIYQKFYWDHCNLGALKAQNLATIVFDQAVNAGTTQAAKRLQHAYNNSTRDGSLVVDGSVGPKTVKAINAKANTYAIKKEFIKMSYVHYAKIVRDDSKVEKTQYHFIVGWIKRANRLLDLLRSE